MTQKNSRARVTQSSHDESDEEEAIQQKNTEVSLAGIDDYVNSDMEDVPVQDEVLPTLLRATQPSSFIFEESLVYQIEMMNTRFNAMKERLGDF